MDAGWAWSRRSASRSADGGHDVRLGAVVVPFHGDEHLGRVGTRRALGRLPPAPAPRAHQAGVVDEDDLALGGGLALARAEVRERLRARGGSDRRGAGDRALVEHRDRQAVADRDEVADVDERVDRRDRALLGETAQECLGGRAVGRRVDAEGSERTSPGGERRQLGEWRVPDPGQHACCSASERRDERRRRGAVRYPFGVNDAAGDRGEAGGHVRVVRESSVRHGRR